MSRLIPIADWTAPPRASVIFVHGLGGHPYTTWTHTPADPATLWPLWLAEDLPGFAVWSLAFDSPPTNWLGTAMPLLDQAANILRTLVNEPALQHGPLIFVCHSLGGLLVKQLLRDANEQRIDPAIGSLLDRTRLVTFIATPHTGSGKATLLETFCFLAWPSRSARDLVANKPELRHLNFAYRALARARTEHLRHLTYFETTRTTLGEIVAPAFADPGISDCVPVPIPANHITIAKPQRRDELPYREIANTLADLTPALDSPGTLRTRVLEPYSTDPSWHHLVPALVRIAALVLLAFSIWRGVSWVASLKDDSNATRQATTAIAAQLASVQRTLQDLAQAQPIPGAERHTAEAVDNIAAGATTDPRLQLALDLLSQKRIDEAAHLLQTVAEEKTARITSDRRDAAAAWRNLGAIAGFADPSRALDAYRKSLDLDPDNSNTLFQVGWLEKERGQLDHAEQRFRRVLSRPKAEVEVGTRTWVLFGLGDIQRQLGNVQGAMANYNSAGAIALRLAAADPSNVRWQRDLSAWHEKLGDAQADQGNLSASLANHKAGRAIRERLAATAPTNAQWHRNLSISQFKVGDLQLSQGHFSAALDSYVAGRAITERLVAVNPANAEWQNDLSLAHYRVGNVQTRQGNLPAALDSYQTARAIAERLILADPANAGWQRDLSLSYYGTGKVQTVQGNLPAALDSYEAAHAIAKHLAAVAPANALWQRDLAFSYQNMGDLHAAKGNFPAALDSYETGLAIAERLVAVDPANAGWQRDLLVWHVKLGDMQRAQREFTSSLASYRSAVAIAERLATANPTNAQQQLDLALLRSRFGNAQLSLGNLPAARDEYQAGLAIAKRLAAADPTNTEWQSSLSLSHQKLGNVQRAQGDFAAALASHRIGLAISEGLVAADSTNAEWQRNLAMGLGNLALADTGPDSSGRALALLHRARDIIRHLAAKSPTDVTLPRDLTAFDAEIARRTP